MGFKVGCLNAEARPSVRRSCVGLWNPDVVGVSIDMLTLSVGMLL